MNFSNETSVPLFEASALSGFQVNDLFIEITRLIITKNRHKLIIQDSSANNDIVLLNTNAYKPKYSNGSNKKQQQKCC